MRTPHAVEVELYKPPPFLMRIVGASLQSQNPSLPPSSFLIGNRWLRWMFRQEGERNGRLKSKWVVQLWWIPNEWLQVLNEASSWHHHHSQLTTVNDWNYMSWDKPSCLGPLLIYLSTKGPPLFCWVVHHFCLPSIQTKGSCGPPRISKKISKILYICHDNLV